VGGGLNRWSGDRIVTYLLDSGLPSTSIQALYEDASGRLWVGTSAGLALFQRDRFVTVRDTQNLALDHVFSITGDRAGRVWLADSRRGLFRIVAGRPQPVQDPGAGGRHIYQLAADEDGGVWIGYYEGGIATAGGATPATWSARDGLADGPVQAILRDATGTIWVGTRSGLSRLRHGSWTTWTAQQGLPEGGVYGLVEDQRGGLWLLSAAGLLRLGLAELQQVPDGAPARLAYPLYGLHEGLRMPGGAGMANPRAIRASDGRLWIATDDGASIVDPRRIRGNPVPPPVVIEQLLVDGQPVDLAPGSEIVFRGEQVQFTYAGLSLMEPERVHFRYRLEGATRGWTDVGTQRTVVFGKLSYGRYRFRVEAWNSDGVRSVADAVVAFRIPPYFYQTYWFYASCATLIGLGVWVFHRLRLRRVVVRFRLIAEERARLTRELHDSLLQGFSGVVYQLEAAVRLFESAPEKSRHWLTSAIDGAERALKEARSAIVSMRLPALEDKTLPEALSLEGVKITEGTAVAFHLDTSGRVRHLAYHEQAGLFLIGREAINNAVNHARGTKVRAGLAYSDQEVCLTVQDNGTGFDPSQAAAKTDHWGMRGMRERAQSIGAEFRLETVLGQGTTITVVVRRKK